MGREAKPDGATPGGDKGDGNGQQPDPQQPASGAGSTSGTATGQQGTPDNADAAMATDAGRAALQAERQARRDAEARATAAETAAKDATSDRDKAIADAKAEARREILEDANARLIRAEVVAAAAGKMANPQLAPKLLDLTAFKVERDGTVDAKDLAKAIDKLLEDEPYLAGRAAPGSADGGRQGTPAGSQPSMDKLLRIAAGHEG